MGRRSTFDDDRFRFKPSTANWDRRSAAIGGSQVLEYDDSNVLGIAGGDAGNLDATGDSAEFYYANGLAIDVNGNLVVADTCNSAVGAVVVPPGVHSSETKGVVTTLAGGCRRHVHRRRRRGRSSPRRGCPSRQSLWAFDRRQPPVPDQRRCCPPLRSAVSWVVEIADPFRSSRLSLPARERRRTERNWTPGVRARNGGRQRPLRGSGVDVIRMRATSRTNRRCAGACAGRIPRAPRQQAPRPAPPRVACRWP